MKSLNALLININNADSIVKEMITNAKNQGVLNFDFLYAVEAGLKQLNSEIKENDKVSKSFFWKWDPLIGSVSRVFEGHPLLDILIEIDNEIVSYK